MSFEIVRKGWGELTGDRKVRRSKEKGKGDKEERNFGNHGGGLEISGG